MASQQELTSALRAAKERQKAKQLRNKIFLQQNMLPSPDDVKEPNPVEVNRFGDTAAEFSAPFRQNMSQIIDRSSFDRPLVDRAKDVGNLALSGLGAAYTGAAGLAGDVLGGDRTQERKAGRDAFILGEVAVPQLAGGMPSAVGRMVRQGAQLPARQEMAQAAQNINVTPTLGMQGPAAGLVEAGLDKVPFSTNAIRNASQRTQDQMANALDNAVDKVGVPTTNTGAGEALQRGTDGFIKSFVDKSNDLYAAVDKQISPNTFVTAPKTINLLEELTKNANKYPSIDKLLSKPAFKSILRDLQSGDALNALPYEILKDLRSTIGGSVGKLKGPMTSLKDKDLNRLYGALTDDLRGVASAAGPQALRAFENANSFYRAGKKRIDGALKKVTGADQPEKAYANILALTTADSPRGSTKLLNQIRQSLPKSEWSAVSATILRKLGDKEDVFSPSQFLKNWNKMDKSARIVLTSGNVPRAALKELDSLATVAKRYRDKPISTGSAATNAMLSFVVGVPALGLGKTMAIAGATWGSAHVMTNPAILKAINAAAAGNFTKLNKLAREDSALGSEAATLLRLVSAETARQQDQQ